MREADRWGFGNIELGKRRIEDIFCSEYEVWNRLPEIPSIRLWKDGRAGVKSRGGEDLNELLCGGTEFVRP